RTTAVDALKSRPRAEYLDVLVEGLSYPWAPVANHAAEALISLQLREVVPRLIRMLDDGDPRIVFQKNANGKPVFLIRELVRINHLRNCLLCHAPAFNNRDPVVGHVPDSAESLSPAYSRDQRSPPFVRADVTYIRQDFAVMQPVVDPGNSPKV